jgi:2-dehydropantoate 2-reductase
MTDDRIAIMGAGAVGCYYGALLARAGAPVTLIGRQALAGAVAAHGLLLEEGGRTERIEVPVATTPEAVGGAGLVLLTVKAGDLEAACRAIAPHLAPDAVVLSLQNGVGQADRAAALLGRPVIATVVYAAVAMAGPGRVRHSGGGRLILADGPASAAVARRLGAAGIPAEVSPDVARTLWTKLTVNCVYNALSAIARQPYGPIVAQPGAEQVMRAAMEECRAVAAAAGVALPEDLWRSVRDIAEAMPAQYSSMAQDLMRGRPTEIEFLNGEILRRAAAAGIPVPVNTTLCVLVRLAEQAAAADTA